MEIEETKTTLQFRYDEKYIGETVIDVQITDKIVSIEVNNPHGELSVLENIPIEVFDRVVEVCSQEENDVNRT